MNMSKWMSVLLALCMLLSLTPMTVLADESGDVSAVYGESAAAQEPAQEKIIEAAPAEESGDVSAAYGEIAAVQEPVQETIIEAAPAEPPLDSGDGTVPVVIIDDTTGSEFTQMHGKVTLPGYSYYGDYVLEKYYISRGDTVTISAVPDEGYEIGSLQVFYKTTANGPNRELTVDEATNSFLLPARGPVYVTIHVTFTSIVTYDDYGVSVTVNDGGTGNTVTVDKQRAAEGELITVSVNMDPGTRFAGVGLIAHKAGDGAAMVELTQVDESTYTFLMPASDADIYAQFEFIEPDVYSISFPDDYSPVLSTLIYKNGEYEQGIVWDADTQAPNGTGWGSPGDTIRLDIRSGGSYTVTGVVLHYEIDGQACEETLEVTPGVNGISSIRTGFTMPASDVSLELILTPFYRIYLESNHYGSAALSATEAFAGQEVTLTAEITDPLCSNLIWTSTIYRSSEIVPSTVEQMDGQTVVLKITMPANAVTLGVDFARTPVPYVSRSLNENRSVMEEEEKELLVYRLLSEVAGGETLTLTDDAYDGWYVLDGTLSCGIRIDGDVKLVLTDGASINANNSVYIPEDSSLTIYGQSGDSGTLYAEGYVDDKSGRAGIMCEGELTVVGGQITAIGGRKASGIGSSEGGSCGSVTINGGSVTGEGGSGAAGIGGNGSTVIINGGKVNAVAGGKSANAFGVGDGGLRIYREAMVRYGDFSGDKMNYEAIAEAADRVNMCKTRDFVEVDRCDHQGAAYTVTEKTHQMHCAHCDTVFKSEEHVLDEQSRCSVCGEWILLGPGGPDDPIAIDPDDPPPVPVGPATDVDIDPDNPISTPEPSGLLSDCNDDGVVDRQDRVYLARALARWDGYPVPEASVADCNDDGKADRQDRVYLARYLAGWDGYSLNISDDESTPDSTASDSSTEDGNEATQEDIIQKGTDSMLRLRIGDVPVTVEWEDNESVHALKDLCSDKPLTIQMSMYGGFEQVGSSGASLPRNDLQTTTGAGDIVLYSGNQIVVFYGSNSWAYSRLGHITDQDAAGMAKLLGNGDVTITISTN